MAVDPKKRGLGRGLDALFRDVKKEEKSFTPPQPAAAGTQKTPAPPPVATRAPAPEGAERNPAPVKRADEIVTAAQALKTPAPISAPVQAAATSAAGQAGQRKIAVEKLVPGKFQPRRHFDDTALEQLAESIRHHGILQPLLVRAKSGGMFEIIAGERRWRAAQQAKLHELPVIVQDLSDKQAMEVALIENLQREDLSAVEEAEGYQRLIDEFSHTQDALAQQMGKSRSHIANTLRLLKLPSSVRTMIQDGSLSAGHARTLVGAKNPEELADAILQRGLSVRQAEKLAQAAVTGKAKVKKIKGFVQKDVDTMALEQKLTGHLGLKSHVLSKGEGKGGTLSVDYKSLDQLDMVVKKLLTK